MSERITVYEKPTCSTCRQVDAILRESGEEYDKINYYVDAIPEGKLRELISKMNITARDLVRTKESLYKELKLDSPSVSDDEIIKAMAKHPDLIQRPIVERGGKAILARPAENIRQIL